jgi:hypothetical protein
MTETLTERIHRLTEELNQRLEATQQKYQEWNYGVPAIVDTPFGTLSYERRDSNWELVIIDKEQNAWSALRAPRILRAEALLAIPKLTKALELEAEKLADSLTNTLNQKDN